MAPTKRLSRPIPARDQPIRAFNTLAAAAQAKDQGAAEPMTADAIIASAVEAAYRVADDNVREGLRAAEKLRAAAAPGAGATEDARAVATRLMQLTRDIGATWVDLLMAVLRDPELRGLLDRFGAQARRAPGAAPADAVGAVAVTHRVKSRKPIEVTLSPLLSLTSASAPAIGGLYAIDPDKPPIRAVSFAWRQDQGLELRIEAPDDQPPGAYAGAVVNPETQAPIGTLSVRILE